MTLGWLAAAALQPLPWSAAATASAPWQAGLDACRAAARAALERDAAHWERRCEQAGGRATRGLVLELWQEGGACSATLDLDCASSEAGDGRV